MVNNASYELAIFPYEDPVFDSYNKKIIEKNKQLVAGDKKYSVPTDNTLPVKVP